MDREAARSAPRLPKTAGTSPKFAEIWGGGGRFGEVRGRPPGFTIYGDLSISSGARGFGWACQHEGSTLLGSSLDVHKLKLHLSGTRTA